MLSHVPDKINLQPAFNQSKVGKRSDKHCRHTALVIVSARKLIEQKQTEKLFIKVKKKIEFPSQKMKLLF